MKRARGSEVGVDELHLDFIGDRRGMALAALLDLPVQFAPLLLGPAQLLDRGREIEEVNGHDRRPGAQVCVADQGVEFPASLDDARVDLAKTFGLLGRVSVRVVAAQVLS